MLVKYVTALCHKHQNKHPTSTHHNSTAMAAIDKAIEELEFYESAPQYPDQKYALK